jgi:hypothetical protein
MKRTFLDQKAKEALRKGVRGLRERLIGELTESLQSEYQLGIAADKAKLSAERREKRRRLELSLEERARTAPKAGQGKQSKQKSGEVDATELRLAATEAAHTLLNRLTFLRILEHHGVLKPALVTGGWESPAFEQEFAHYGAEFKDEPSRGYLHLLEAVYAEYALDLPALFGPVGITTLFPVPVPTLRAVLELLSDPALDSAWGDDTTLGWIYQFWNDPERERLDAKLKNKGKLEPQELGPKTQMFTERYMVEWLLQNTLGQTWLAMCKKHNWTADFEQVREALEARRAAFRRQREAGDLPLDALMPIEGELEEHWKYWVPQPLPDEAVAAAPETLRDLKLLDPACGSGHFLVIAFDFLATLYEEEARHRGETWSPTEIAHAIVERNLHGVDIDARAIQLSAAGLWLKAKLYAPNVEFSRMNLVAPVFRLGALPEDDPSLVRLCDELARFLVPNEVTRKLVEALSGVDHLGTLLRVDDEVGQLLEKEGRKDEPLLNYPARKKRAQVFDRLTDFLDEHATEADLGLRLEGEQLEAGMRFVGIAKKDTYDIVVGNPPYQGTNKMAQAAWFKKHYRDGRADLYSCFLERALELTRPGGYSALLTMRSWMFLSQFQTLRQKLITSWDLRALGDFDRGAFDDVPNEILSVVVSVFAKRPPTKRKAVAIQPTPYDDASYDRERTNRKRAATLLQVGRFDFDVAKLSVVEGMPLVFWWGAQFLDTYAKTPKLGATAPGAAAQSTGDNQRFTRNVWEVYPIDPNSLKWGAYAGDLVRWYPFVNGPDGRAWVEPFRSVVDWHNRGLHIKMYKSHQTGRDAFVLASEEYFLRRAIAFTKIGAKFGARLHRVPSIFADAGSSVFPADSAPILTLLNSRTGRFVLQSLNPTINFQVGDVNRVPVIPQPGAEVIQERLLAAFARYESHRESSVEFSGPGTSEWHYAQDWAQRAVDRRADEPLPSYEPELDPADPVAHVSFAVGASLGRFGPNGEGTLKAAPADALPAGILYIASDEALNDSLKHPAAQRLLAAWKEHAPAVLQGKRQSLKEWLKKDFLKYHLGVYENRPIYFPLASSQKSFVAFISIHRWTDGTLQDLLALHLTPALRQLAGEIADLNKDRASSDKVKSAAAEKQFMRSKRLHDELADFIASVTECAERGAPPTDASCPPRAQDAKFHMDLDDGVMINSAALWPLLDPLWSKPKVWWKTLCQGKGRQTDYDWSHLARRYFPARVDDKCKEDPSLAVAHGCFWKYHPARAYAWELRLQHEIKPTFTIDEPDSDASRTRFLAEYPDEAAAIRERAQVRGDESPNTEPQTGANTPKSDDDSDPDDAGEDDDA